jgi:hypothetical protein
VFEVVTTPEAFSKASMSFSRQQTLISLLVENSLEDFGEDRQRSTDLCVPRLYALAELLCFCDMVGDSLW